jgi:hypothetical protein
MHPHSSFELECIALIPSQVGTEQTGVLYGMKFG